jgi:polyisoprenoid-binding protein YceI
VRLRIVLAVLAGLAAVVAVLAGVWWFLIRSEAEPATEPLAFREATPTSTPAASTGDTPSPTAGAGGATGDFTRYVIVPEHPDVEGRTEAWYLAGETLARIGVPSTAKGTTSEVSGEFFIGKTGLDPNNVSRVVVKLANLRSDESRRDTRVREALEVTRYPEASFTIEAIEGWPGEIPEGQDVKVTLVGTMELHGVKRTLEWETVARRRGNVITALATTKFRYEDFDIPVLNIAGFVSVEEEVTVQIQVIAVAQ